MPSAAMRSTGSPLQDDDRRQILAEPCRLYRRPPSQPDRDLLRARRRRGGDSREPASRRFRAAWDRGARPLRSGRCLLGQVRARLRRQAVPVGDARGGRPRQDPLAEGDAAAADEAPASAVATLAALFKDTLGDKVSAVRASSRLTASPVCLVATDLGPDRQLEKLLARHEQIKERPRRCSSSTRRTR